LPLLYQDVFIGRMDCKAHRKDKHFEIKFLHLEPSIIEKKAFDLETFLVAFTASIQNFIHFQGCDLVSLSKMQPANLSKEFRGALNALS